VTTDRTRPSLEGALPDLLASLLGASGVSRGALFVRDATTIEPGSAAAPHGLVLRAQVGFSSAAADRLGTFLGHPEIFERAVATKSPLVVGLAVDNSADVELLAAAGAKSALLVPFVADRECLGILLLASVARDLTEGDWIPFAQTMAVQIGHSLALSSAFSKVVASEHRYSRLVETASDCIFTLDNKGFFRDVNPAMERFLGRPRSEIIGAHSSAFVAPDERERSARQFGLLLEQGSVRVDAGRFTRPDGSLVMGDISATAADLEGGLALCIMRDVTEKNRAAGEMGLLQSVPLAASEAADLVSAFGIVLQKICETNGWSAGAAWVPRSETGFLEHVCLWTRDPAEGARLKALTEPVFASGQGVLGRAWASNKPLWVRDLAVEKDCLRSATAAELGIHAVLAVPVVVDKSAIAIMEFFMDRARSEDARFVILVSTACAQLASILARKKAEDALRASEARFTRLAESGVIGIVVADVDGNILEANDAYLDLVGYSREELVGGKVRWADLTPPEFKDLSDSAVAQLREHGVARAWETETFRKDGSRVPTLVGVAMLDYPNCIAFVADRTDRKRAETALLKTEGQLRQAQKMEAVGRLAGGVAHDFNNVLSVILSYGEFILGDLEPGDPIRDDVEQIRKAADRAAGLTRQLLMFSRQVVLEPKVLDLNEVLIGMDKMLRRILGEDVDMVSLSSPSLARVRLDPSSIEQVIMNLVVNARDAMPTGGKLTIETGNVMLDEHHAADHDGIKPGPHVMLAVSDTGIGMDRATGSASKVGAASRSTASPARGRASRCTCRVSTRRSMRPGQLRLPRMSVAPRRSCSWKTRSRFARWPAASSASMATAFSRHGILAKHSYFPKGKPARSSSSSPTW
jgi:PAS domain S-box-containing protein